MRRFSARCVVLTNLVLRMFACAGFQQDLQLEPGQFTEADLLEAPAPVAHVPGPRTA
jgi:hypothetical protein